MKNRQPLVPELVPPKTRHTVFPLRYSPFFTGGKNGSSARFQPQRPLRRPLQRLSLFSHVLTNPHPGSAPRLHTIYSSSPPAFVSVIENEDSSIRLMDPFIWVLSRSVTFTRAFSPVPCFCNSALIFSTCVVFCDGVCADCGWELGVAAINAL